MNHFYIYIKQFNNTIFNYENTIESIYLNPSDEKCLDCLHKLNLKLYKELNLINWMVELLHNEHHRNLLAVIHQALCYLSSELNHAKEVLENCQSSPFREKIQSEIELINEIYSSNYRIAMDSTSKKISFLLGNRDVLPLSIQSEFTGHINLRQVALLQNDDKEKRSYPKKSLSNKIIYSSKFLPLPIQFYYLSKHKNDPARKDNIIDMLKGRLIDTEKAPFKNEKGLIPDKFGQLIYVPRQFADDLLHSHRFILNGKKYIYRGTHNQIRGEPNETARSIFEIFGKEGAENLMHLCNHSIITYPMEIYIFPLLGSHGTFSKLLPTQLLLPNEFSGVDYNIHINNRDELVIEIKILLGLHTAESKFTAYFVLKTSIVVPIKLFINEKIDEIKLKRKLNIEDKISSLIINNPEEAKEVFEKF